MTKTRLEELAEKAVIDCQHSQPRDACYLCVLEQMQVAVKEERGRCIELAAAIVKVITDRDDIPGYLHRFINEKLCSIRSGHVWFECSPGAHDQDEFPGNCMFCAGGLVLCTKCDCFEGELPRECPGAKMTVQQKEDVYAMRQDFIAGE